MHYEFTPGFCHACCSTITGNVDCDPTGHVDISDLIALIDYLYISRDPLCCSHSADVDGDRQIDISDLTRLIDRLYISFAGLEPCSL